MRGDNFKSMISISILLAGVKKVQLDIATGAKYENKETLLIHTVIQRF
jgi:hypothetical protein